MTRLLVSTSLFALAVGAAAFAGPVDGPSTTAQRIEADAGKKVFQVEFRGGERACVIAIGDHEPPVPMAVIVYDEKMTKVAEDYGSEATPDYVAAMWYPPRTAKYLIEVRSQGKDYNKVFITVR
jgi:hypothetical protein